MAALTIGAHALQARRRHRSGENEQAIIRMRQLASQRAGFVDKHADVLRPCLGINALEEKAHLLRIIGGLIAHVMNPDWLG